FDEHAALRARRRWDTYPDKRKMNVISRSVAAEINCVVALCQALRILNRNSLPGFAAIHRDVVIACITWPWRTSSLKGSGDNVSRILRIDCDGNFSGIDRVRIGNSYDSLRQRLRRKTGKNYQEYQ